MYHSPITIHAMPPTNATITTTVKIPAPARSPVVTGSSVSPEVVSTLPAPAFGFPTLVPPVVFVNGTCVLAICVEMITSSADICWPTPVVPSHTAPSVHFKPHNRPLAPPEHCRAAAVAEVTNAVWTWSVMKGATLAAAAIQRERKALKDNMSVSQVGGLWFSQASSTMMPVEFWVKTMRAASRMPCVRSFHMAEPLVCSALLDMLRVLQDEEEHT